MWKKSQIMESSLRLQIEKLEAKLKRYRIDNEELQDLNTKLEVLIKLHKMQKESKEKKIKKLKSSRKTEQSTEDIEEKLLDK